MDKHTPGPWAQREKPGPRDVTLKRQHWEVGSLETGDGIAIVFHDVANARLIAKSPEMFAFLEKVAYGDHYGDPGNDRCCDECIACEAMAIIQEIEANS